MYAYAVNEFMKTNTLSSLNIFQLHNVVYTVTLSTLFIKSAYGVVVIISNDVCDFIN